MHISYPPCTQNQSKLFKKIVLFFCFVLWTSSAAYAEETWTLVYKKADSLMQMRAYDASLDLHRKALPLAEKEFGQKSEQYFNTLNNLGRCLISAKDETQQESFLKSTEQQALLLMGEKSLAHARACLNLGTYYFPGQRGNDMAMSKTYLEKALDILKTLPENAKVYHMGAVNNLAALYVYLEKFVEAEALLLETIQFMKAKHGAMHPDYASALNNLGALYFNQSKYTQAKLIYEQVLNIRQATLGRKSLEYAQALNNLAVLYEETSNYVEAADIYQEVLTTISEVYGKNHSAYANALTNFSIVQMNVGNYNEASMLLDEALAITKQLFGENSLDYAKSLNNHASLDYMQGNYSSAEPRFKKSLEIYARVLGENHSDYAMSLQNIGLTYNQLGNYKRAEVFLKKALKVLQGNLKEVNDFYATLLANLAELYIVNQDFKQAEYYVKEISRYNGMDQSSRLQVRYQEILGQLNFRQNNFDASLKHYSEALRLSETLGNGKSIEYVNSCFNLASAYTVIGRYKAADTYFVKTDSLYRILFTNQSDKYLKLYSNLAYRYMCAKEWDKARFYSESTLKTMKKLISSSFSFMSEAEKISFIDNNINVIFNVFGKIAISYKPALSDLYNALLFRKGVILSSNQKTKERILNSNDSLLIEQYKTWANLKGALTKYAQMPKEEIIQKGIQIDSLETVSEALEKELVKRSESFAELTQVPELTWKDVQKGLKPKQAAIEMLKIALNDSIWYAALIIKKNSTQPELVLMSNGKELENKYATYQKNMIEFKGEDLISYEQFWQPIAQRLKGIKKVYFAPDGIYSQISLNTLMNPKTKKYLLEEIDLHMVTNTKDILAFDKNLSQKLTATLLGYPIYDNQKFLIEDSVQRAEFADTTRAFANFQQISLLPGTRREVESIQKILNENRYQTELLIEQSATEDNIKKIKNPQILHLSTHGFFINSREPNTKLNPMTRSGLLLTGVSDYTRAEEKPNSEDGILTAQEAANLELDNTDLVVLSACETGLGDVKAGEGVFGLQRAFKVAGAKRIIMSLWKVDDVVTQKLMVEFYKQYAKHGQTRLAFKEAQIRIKKEYPEPYYWGAFVMSGD
ncbi:MAG: CHAT domain-containing protein [Cytophagales bacterium]|nr:MAG: CHAT domain-containing protein [Cytophagales bacterium]TAF60323.1 MAG: CHAT domain-containing protein [Cytophagales bacterium]